jgi:hypothetical protein
MPLGWAKKVIQIRHKSFLVYADVNLLGRNINIKKKILCLSGASKKVCIEVNAEKSKCMPMNAG